MSSSKDDNDRTALDRRAFLKAGTLGAAALAAGAAGRVTVAGETMPAQGGQAQSAEAPAAQAQPGPAPRSSPFHRNFDPVPASEPSMNFAVFTDTHVGQQMRSPNWDYAQHLDLPAKGRTTRCHEFVVICDGAFNSTVFVNGVGLPESKSNYKNN